MPGVLDLGRTALTGSQLRQLVHRMPENSVVCYREDALHVGQSTESELLRDQVKIRERWFAYLPSVPDLLIEDPIFIADAIAIGCESQGCHGVQEAG